MCAACRMRWRRAASIPVRAMGASASGLKVAIEGFERASRMPVSGLATHALLRRRSTGESQIVTGKIEARCRAHLGRPALASSR